MSALPGFSGIFHTDASRHSPRRLRSSDGFFAPLASLIRKPAIVLERFIEDFRPPPLESATAYEENENRKQILHLNIQSVSARS